MKVISIQDISALVLDAQHRDKLHLELVRDSSNINSYKLTISVRRNIDSKFDTSIILQSSVIGPEDKVFKISFDPSIKEEVKDPVTL